MLSSCSLLATTYVSFNHIMIKSIQFPFLTVYEVARATELTVPCIYRHIHDGHLDAVKVPGFRQFMIEPAALTIFLKARAKRSVRSPYQETG